MLLQVQIGTKLIFISETIHIDYSTSSIHSVAFKNVFTFTGDKKD